MTTTRTISIRLPIELADRLEAEVKRRRMKDGSAATKAVVIREALQNHLEATCKK